MIRCRVLGSVELRDDESGDVEPLLAQPKRLALLVYLLVAKRGGFHRRDTLLAMFWPELDETRARDNLSQALRFLRQSLGSAAISTRGADDVGIDAERVWCDATAFRGEIDAGRTADALELYHGDLLQGFFVAEAPGFQDWLEAERGALRTDAARAARQLAEDSEQQRNLTLAVRWGRRAAALAGDDERAFRRLLALLARAGDRVGALRAYDEFSRRLRLEYEAEPAAETRALAEQIRRQSGGNAVAVASPPPSPSPYSPIPADSPDLAGHPRGADAQDFDDTPLTAGDSLAQGSYVIERPLGAGGMATVYLARDVRHGRKVAIKVLRPEIGTLAGRRALLHEIRIAAALQHPHIVPLFDSGESNGRVFYVMPYIVGESLRAYISRSSEVSVRDALRMLREVASALAYAHRSGIVHRDIKPENILLAGDTAKGEVNALVADFGIAKALDATISHAGMTGSLSVAAHPLGTPGYMAPEQAAGDPVDRPADIYSWGVVAYELLAGAHPFAGKRSPQALIAAHLGDRPTPLTARRADVPPALGAVVMRCLEKDPAARPADGTKLLEALEGESPEEHSSVPVWRRFRAAGMRRMVVIGALAALGAVGVWVAANASRDRAADVTSGSGVAPNRVAETDPSHIAVLYFEDLSPGDTLGYVASGITTYLTDELAAVPGLTVASLDAVRRLRGETISLDSMARWLGVRSLVTGSVASHEDTLAVTVRLVDGITGRQLASAEEQRASRDVFKLQRELALRISSVLRERLGQEIRLRDERRGTQNVEAWNLLEQARSIRESELWFASFVPESLQLQYYDRADSMLTRAERIDPRWSAPHVEHSTITLRRATAEERRAATRGKQPTLPEVSAPPPPAYWRAEALRHAERALELSPGDPRALLARGRARNLFWRAATDAPDSLASLVEADLRAAAEANPASGAWSDLSTHYRLTGRFQEAALASERAVASDAYLRWSQDIVQELVANALFLGRFDEARERCADGKRRFPRDPRIIDCDLIILAWTGDRPADADRAWRLVEQHEREDSSGMLAATRPFRRTYVAAVLARAGLRDSAEAIVRHTRAELERRGTASSVDLWESYVHVLAGRPREAVDRLTKYLATNPAYRGLVANTPWFRPLHEDSSFVRLVTRRR